MKAAKTAVVYARYSSDLQKDRSIDDQIALCKQIAARQGLTVSKIYTDRGLSGASMFERDGLLGLMTAAKKREFNFVISESLSRLSRDMEDTAAIYKRLKFNEISIIDTNGEVGDVHIGVGAIVNSQFLKNLATSVKRGRDARVREGLIPGKVSYGYRKVTDKPGVREIDDAQAKIVLRIFEEYVSGIAPREICERLMAERVPGPQGAAHWNFQKLITGGGNGGLLGNQLYIGKLVWNVFTQVKNPETGKRNNRRAKEEDRIEVDVPHLRIVPQKLWDAAQAMRESRRKAVNGPRIYRHAEKSRMMLGILRCAVCGGRMMIGQANMDGSPRIVCTFAARRINCTHRKSYCLKEIERTVFEGIKAKLTDRKALIEMTKAYHARSVERQKEVRAEADAAQKELNRVTVAIDRIVTAISDSDAPVKGLVDKLNALEVQRAGLTEKVRLIEADGNVVTLHPAAIDTFSVAMDEMHKALTSNIDDAEYAPFRQAFYNVFERIAVHPTAKRTLPMVTPYARLSAILGFEMFPTMRSAEQMLAEQGVSATKISSPTGNYTDRKLNSESLISLGIWRLAAIGVIAKIESNRLP